jgi:hypothetical protein
MDIFEIALPATQDPAALIVRIERAVAEAGLEIGQRMTLHTYPGSIHWHLRHAGAKGVLELTYWPSRRRLWLAVHANRQASWIARAIERLRATIEQAADQG